METDQKRRIIEDGSRCGWVDGTVDKFPFIGSQEVGRRGSDGSKKAFSEAKVGGGKTALLQNFLDLNSSLQAGNNSLETLDGECCSSIAGQMWGQSEPSGPGKQTQGGKA